MIQTSNSQPILFFERSDGEPLGPNMTGVSVFCELARRSKVDRIVPMLPSSPVFPPPREDVVRNGIPGIVDTNEE